MDLAFKQYLHAIVAKYTVENGPASDGEREACALVRLRMGGTRRDLVGFQLSGSYEKGTAITLGAHVDILVSVKKPGDAKDVYMSLYPHCLDKHLPPEAHGVGIRISSNGVKVHIIPWNLDRVEQEGSNGPARNGHHNGAEVALAMRAWERVVSVSSQTRSSTTVAPAPPWFCGGSVTDSTCGCFCRNWRSAFRSIPIPLP